MEYDRQTFILKIWLEETLQESGRAIWRGHITHVPSGERRYVQCLDDIVAFIMFYLEAMGVKADRYWRLRQSLRRWKLS
jgi:hypothetical protein